MKRFCLSKKEFTPKEANTMIQNCFQTMSVHKDNINYWTTRVGKKLDFLDTFILGTDKIQSPEEFIEISLEEIDWLSRKIYEDYGRYVEVKNTCG